MTGRPDTALLIVDLQRGVMAETVRRDEVIATVRDLVRRARAAQVPVIWVQHSSDELPVDSDAWRLALEREDGEPLIHKRHGDSFEDTALEEELARRGVGRLVVAGAQTDACVRATLHGAFVRGYDTILVADAHTTEDLTAYGLPSPELVIAHTNRYWTWQTGPGRVAGVVRAAEVEFGGR